VRVAFLTHNYPRTPGDVSGAFLRTLAIALVERGTEVTVIAPSDLGVGGEETDHGVRVRRVRYASAAAETIAYRGTMAGALRRPGSACAFHGLWRSLRRAARDELASGADLIHAHWWVPGGWAAPPEGRLVITCHGTDVALLGRSAIARALARPVFARAHVVTAVSAATARTIEAATGRRIDNSHVQPMPLDTTAYAASAAGGAGAITLGRLSPQKRFDLAIEAVALLRDRGRTLPLTIVGDGAARAGLEELARARRLESLVTFTGAVPPRDIPARLRRADVMLFPAAGEGFGLAAAEAFLSGVPVVACTDGGGVLDIVPTDGAGRRAAPTADAIAAAAEDLLADPAARPNAGAEGDRWRARLSPAAAAASCKRWYQEALHA
jgi:glycosyltransferase involved in cell wall biosynthesis